MQAATHTGDPVPFVSSLNPSFDDATSAKGSERQSTQPFGRGTAARMALTTSHRLYFGHLKVKSGARLEREHAGITHVAASKRIAQVHLVALVGEIGSHGPHRPPFTDLLVQCEIEGVIAGQMLRPIAVQEARAVNEVKCCGRSPWQ